MPTGGGVGVARKSNDAAHYVVKFIKCKVFFFTFEESLSLICVGLVFITLHFHHKNQLNMELFDSDSDLPRYKLFHITAFTSL